MHEPFSDEFFSRDIKCGGGFDKVFSESLLDVKLFYLNKRFIEPISSMIHSEKEEFYKRSR